MTGLHLPDWMAMPEWLEPKLLVLFVLVGLVLYLSREPVEESAKPKPAEPRQAPRMLEHGQR